MEIIFGVFSNCTSNCDCDIDRCTKHYRKETQLTEVTIFTRARICKKKTYSFIVCPPILMRERTDWITEFDELCLNSKANWPLKMCLISTLRKVWWWQNRWRFFSFYHSSKVITNHDIYLKKKLVENSERRTKSFFSEFTLSTVTPVALQWTRWQT